MKMRDQEKFDALWEAIEEDDVDAFERELEDASDAVLRMAARRRSARPTESFAIDHHLTVNMSTLLFVACARGRSQMVERLISRGARAAGEDDDLPPLFIAVLTGNIEIVRVLLQHGADPRQLNDSGVTALDWAIAASRLAIAMEMLAHCGQLPDTHAAVLNGDLTTCPAPELNATDMYGSTPLHYAAYSSNCQIISELLELGVSPDSANQFGQTALHWASGEGHLEAVRLLIGGGANPLRQDNFSLTPLARASAHGHLPTVEYLVQISNPNSRTLGQALHQAVEGGHPSVVEFLIDAGANVDLYTPSLTFTVVKLGQSEEVRHRQEYPPLHTATVGGNLEIAKLLVDGGAAINAEADNMTAMLLACLTRNPDMLSLLIQGGGDMGWRSWHGTSALHWAAGCNAPECVRLLVTAGAEIEDLDDNGRTPLMHAALHDAVEALTALTQCGADLDAVARCDGMRPLHIAVAAGAWHAAVALVSAGADVNARSSDGFTPLLVAAVCGDDRFIQMLIDSGADVHDCLPDGRNWQDLSRERGLIAW
jgi:ankyrin repeat protein